MMPVGVAQQRYLSLVLHVCRSIINNVLNVFRPKRWVLTMVADKAGLDTITENPFDVEKVGFLSSG